jgi:hypothetical protein
MAVFPKFKTLCDNYPMGSAIEVKHLIGGRVDADWVANTCAIRLSRAFNYAGAPIPYSKETISGSDGRWYIFRVRVMDTYLRATYDDPDLTVKKQGAPITAAQFLHKTGIIHFDVQFSDATGHFTLWDGSACSHGDYFDKARSVDLWLVA